jgi:hypothetical protein
VTALWLPQACPECGTWLQRPLTAGDGVRPHFDACHPGMPVPTAQEV